MITDPSERGIERRICAALTGSPRDAALAQQGPNGKAAVPSGGEGWVCARPGDYDRNYTVDLAQLIAFLAETQPDAYKALQLKADSPVRRKFLARLQSEVGKRGVMTCYARGLITVRITSSSSTATPSPGNALAAERYSQNRFSITRQLRYSIDQFSPSPSSISVLPQRTLSGMLGGG